MRDLDLDRISLAGASDLSRRRLLQSGVATGFALAVTPVSADTVIKTDVEGLEAGQVHVPVGDFDIPAYRAMPKSGGPFPVILVIQEIFGVHEHIKDVCRRLAKLGYLAIAPELYFRQGDVSHLKDIPDIQKIVATVPDEQVMSDLDATVSYVGSAGGHGDPARIGITGFCWGGRTTWLFCAHSPDVKAGVAWYGRLVGSVTDNTPHHPVDRAGNLIAPVRGLYGGDDAGIPVDTIDKMRAACKAAGKTCEIVVYPDTPHAFHADYRPSYREGPAKDGWAKMLDWFKKHGVA